MKPIIQISTLPMMHSFKLSLIGLATLILIACDKSDEDALNTSENASSSLHQFISAIKSRINAETEKNTTPEILPPSAFKTIEWTDLMPQDDLDALLNPPSYITDVEDGSIEDQISSQLQNAIAAAGDDRYQQALVSTRIVPEMHDQPVRVPGFIVPLEFNDEQSVTQFFLVPYFGACIHVPPPPPNQIIFVRYAKGVKLDSLYDPFWISGIIKTAMIENETATAAYTLQMQSYEIYTDE